MEKDDGKRRQVLSLVEMLKIRLDYVNIDKNTKVQLELHQRNNIMFLYRELGMAIDCNQAFKATHLSGLLKGLLERKVNPDLRFQYKKINEAIHELESQL
ncbi:hypothetical protein AB733_23070 [Photobacterium swingsii]|uniref:Uncharacterized protein n=1 Tax=Photobacterium swingsii TaxID=680026 RepID=A0A0J8XT57_9GAMM|nr:hypothetical protein [Photobacterium swingsii]KMV28559.1 hypothetical protein AB733_23070 [Photobacterium swingsii]PSW24530.1 hypothetical protein C9I94_10870 [Photobacterium swingsii]